MKSDLNLRLIIQHLKLADEFMADYIRSTASPRIFKTFDGYRKRLLWIVNDYLSQPEFANHPELRASIKKEWEADAFVTPAILEKIAALHPEQRAILEDIIDLVAKGETLRVEYDPKDTMASRT